MVLTFFVAGGMELLEASELTVVGGAGGIDGGGVSSGASTLASTSKVSRGHSPGLDLTRVMTTSRYPSSKVHLQAERSIGANIGKMSSTQMPSITTCGASEV